MRRPYLAAFALVAVLVCLVIFWKAGRARRGRPVTGLATIEFLDIGQGDSILIRSPEGKIALIDAGPSNRVLGLLRDRGISEVDLVAISHHHSDHYGGMAAVIREVRPRVFLDADSPHATKPYLDLLRRVKASGITAIRAGPVARKVELGSVTLTIFPQPPADDKNENNNSIGVRVDFGAFSALLTGDSEGAERRWWVANVPELCRDVDVLKLAHHGSHNGTDRSWLALTRPKLAVASLGRDNEFGHPHRETLALLRSAEIPLRRTDESGSIEVRTDGRTWWFGHEAPVSAETPAEDVDATEQDTGDTTTEPPPDGGVATALVKLNSASREELETLPGIGPTLANRIIERRPYRSVEELSRVPLLGSRRIERLRPLVTAD